MKRYFIIVLLVSLWDTNAFAEDNPIKSYWNCVISLQKVTDADYKTAKLSVLSQSAKSDTDGAVKYVNEISDISIRKCEAARQVALDWRIQQKGDSRQDAEVRLKKVDAMAHDMIKLNIGEIMLFTSQSLKK